MAAPVGNKYAAKARIFYREMMKVGDENPLLIRAMVENVMRNAAAGDLEAIKFVRDTLDGKPAQVNILQGDNDAPLTIQWPLPKTSLDQ